MVRSAARACTGRHGGRYGGYRLFVTVGGPFGRARAAGGRARRSSRRRLGCRRRWCTDPANRDRRQDQAAQRSPHRHPDADRRVGVHAGPGGHQRGSGRRQHAAEPGHPAGSGGGSGLLRTVPHPRRTQWPAVPGERNHPARGHQRVRPVARSTPDLLDEPDHRGAARRIWTADGRHHRYHDQERRPGSGRVGVDVRRQPWNGRAEFQLCGVFRLLQLFRDRRLSAQPPGHRVAGRQLQSDPRRHQAIPRLRLPGRCGGR